MHERLHIVHERLHIVHECLHIVHERLHIVHERLHIVHERLHIVYACWHGLFNECYRHVTTVVHVKFDTDLPPYSYTYALQSVH